MRTSARNVALLLFDEVELLDVAGPLQVLSHAGRHWNWRPFRVFAVAREAGIVETRSQLRLEARHAFGDAPEPELVIVPGGYGARRALDDAELVAWLARTAGRAEIVLAVGYGSLLLAKAGLLANADVAAPADACELIGELGPSARPKSDVAVAESGKLVTASRSAAGLDAGLIALARVLGAKQALGVAAEIGHAWQPDAGAPEPLRIEIVGPDAER
jgi:transcriptional regulator GlxA family with amidase domain